MLVKLHQILILAVSKTCCLEKLVHVHVLHHTAITEDAQIKEGTRFQIICNLKKLSVTYKDEIIPVNSSNIFFTHNSSSEPIQSIEIIDEKSAQIQIQESHLNDSGYYFCYLRIGDYHHYQLVCLMELIVAREFFLL